MTQTVVVGKIAMMGTGAQIDMLKPFLAKANVLIGHCIEPVEVRVKARTDMPLYAPGKHAMGYWRARPRRILLADDCFDPDKHNLAARTLGHELVHVMDGDWFRRWHRRHLLIYLNPEPDNWTDGNIGDTHVGYEALPYECVATWGSAALFGWSRPAYSRLYKRKFLAADFEAVRAIMLEDRG